MEVLMESVEKSKISTKFSKRDFLRQVWTTFAEEDAPIELFSKDLDTVEELEYEVLKDTISADASYRASIGYDRKEPYIDYETYYEEEPYITTETYYDKTIQARRTREVTKYKKVAKQRPITKYKTVTDWSIFSDSRIVNNTTAYVLNKNYSDFDMETFREAYRRTASNEFITLNGAEAVMLKISSMASMKAEKKHNSAIQRSVANSLPGDRYKDLDCSYSIIDQTSILYKVPMYKTSINFNGNTYIKYAFPFGDELKVFGERIENEHSFESVKKQTEETLRKNAKMRRSKIERSVWKRTGFLKVLTMLILLLSIGTSLSACILKTSILHNLMVICIAFGAAVIFFIFNCLYDKLIENKEYRRAEEDIRKEKESMDDMLSHFEEDHFTELQKALNKKLNALD